MSRRIVVSSNCQTAALAAALRDLLPGDVVIPAPIPLPAFPSAEAELPFVEQLNECDLWLSAGHWHLPEKHGVLAVNPKLMIIRIPTIIFSAFHPDLVYARRRSTGEIIVHNYNSAIAIWGFNNGLTIADVAGLFSLRSFSQLGYLTRWDLSVNYLRDRFAETQVEFAKFYLAVKRDGIFMHSLNHPKPGPIVQLAKQISMQFGLDESVFDVPLEIPDSLADTVWPVYPGVGDYLSLPSSYIWTMDGHKIHGLEQYLEYAYQNYEKQGISPGDIEAGGIDEGHFNKVLHAQINHE